MSAIIAVFLALLEFVGDVLHAWRQDSTQSYAWDAGGDSDEPWGLYG